MSDAVDIETSPGQQRTGYIAAAAWLAADPDNETLVFRKLDKLAALNLLYLQSEILEVETRVDKMHQDAENGSMSVKKAARDFETLVSRVKDADPEARRNANLKLELIKELRAKIKEYRK